MTDSNPEANTRLEWSANVQLNSEELPGSYRILLYVGNSRGPTSGSLNDLAGVAPIFSGPQTKPGANAPLNLSIPLTPALIEKSVSLTPEATVPNLVEQLYWYLEKVGETTERVPVTDLKSLQVAVVSKKTEYSARGNALPVKSEPLTYYAPTEGKPGGITQEEPAVVGAKAPEAVDVGLPSVNNTESVGGKR